MLVTILLTLVKSQREFLPLLFPPWCFTLGELMCICSLISSGWHSVEVGRRNEELQSEGVVCDRHYVQCKMTCSGDSTNHQGQRKDAEKVSNIQGTAREQWQDLEPELPGEGCLTGTRPLGVGSWPHSDPTLWFLVNGSLWLNPLGNQRTRESLDAIHTFQLLGGEWIRKGSRRHPVCESKSFFLAIKKSKFVLDSILFIETGNIRNKVIVLLAVLLPLVTTH